MKNKIVFLLVCLLIFASTKAQKFYLGDAITIKPSEFKLVGISSKTGVYNYRYTKKVNEKMFDREIGDIIIGVKDGHIAATVYNLVPLFDDYGVPNSIIDLINANLPYPLKNIDGEWGISLEKNIIVLKRANNAITFGKDMIIFNSSVKYSLLLK